MSDLRRLLPSVDRLLASAAFTPVLAAYPRPLVADVLRSELEVARTELARGAGHGHDADALAHRVAARVDALAAGTLQPVLNATGVVLHTNLGRAPLAEAAVAALVRAAAGYTNLEYQLEHGARGSRYTHCRELLTHLTGAEDALVVNNNAAALVLALNTVAREREAVISRGELVEIGGAFRVPDIMERSGARMREVGATNRTHLEDYEAALSPETGALLKVHPSNFRIEGFAAEVPAAQLAQLGRSRGVPLIHDIGSGLLVDPASVGLPADEPVPRTAIADGADLVTMSGDKLLGGPQCGIVLGRAEVIDQLRRNPLCRALRVDKLTLAALGTTLALHLDPERALREVPVLRMLTTPLAELQTRAEGFAQACRARGIDAQCVPGSSAVGGGASPGAAVETVLIELTHDAAATAIERRLRTGRPPVVARLRDDRVVLDLRTVPPADEHRLLDAVAAACGT